MVKKRIIPKFLIKDGRLVKGVHFHENFREAGNPVTAAKIYDSYGVDELIFLDIQASLENRKTVLDIIGRVSEEIFMPFTVGGGVKTLDHVNDLLRAGADKVSVNTAAFENPAFIKQAAARFGDQCVTVAIDYREVGPGQLLAFTHCGQEITDIDPMEWALRMQDCHCGEIILCSIDRDGTMSGYDLEAIRRLSERLDVPLVASSGAGSLNDCRKALEAGASAITISSMFLFTDHSPIKVRSYLVSNNVDVRANWGSRS
ncbi:imidazole glycerol phosphate synthase subunit HisF [Planctomycetota bacterium]